MFKLFSRYFFATIIGSLALLTATNTLAADLNFKLIPSTDQSALIEVRLDPLAKKLNVVEGTIAFQGDNLEKLAVKVETGGSLLLIWPTPPQYSVTEKIIRFSGGVPGGFSNEGLLFRLRLTSAVAGKTSINWINGTAYLNDGQGTLEPISARSLAVNLIEQSITAGTEISPDKTAPQFEYTDIGQDKNTYDGKIFLSFQATDDLSGVARYEVKEGSVVTVVTSGVYILQDQSRRTPISITAYDQAGNKIETKIPAKIFWAKYVIIILLVVVVIFLFVLKLKYHKK